MPHQNTRQNTRRQTASRQGAADDSALDARIELASRALVVGTRLAPIAVRLWRWRGAIRIVISLAMVAIPLIVRIRALRSAVAAEQQTMPQPYRLPRPIVVDTRALEAEASELPARGS